MCPIKNWAKHISCAPRHHPFSTYAKIFQKTNISNPLIRDIDVRNSGLEVRNVSFS